MTIEDRHSIIPAQAGIQYRGIPIEDRRSITPAQAGVHLAGRAIAPARPSAYSSRKDHLS